MRVRPFADSRYPWAIIAGIVIFALIAVLVLGGRADAIDRPIFLGLAGWARSSSQLMWFLTLISALVEPAVRITGAAMLIAAMLLARHVRMAIFIFVATAGGAALCSLVKALAGRVRPDLLSQLDTFSNYSFPSGHAWNGAIFYGEAVLCALLFLPRHWHAAAVIAAVSLVLVTGLSRIALGVHWPTDVLAGWIGGATWLAICHRLILVREKRVKAL